MAMSLPDRRWMLHRVGVLVLIALVIPFGIFAVPGLVGADGSYVVLSGSMEPSISSGDVVIVDDVDPTAIEAGDVITYAGSDDETPTTHRVIEVVERDGGVAFQTQGDANEHPDASLVDDSDVHGKVIFTIPYIGYVIQFVNTPLGFLALVVVPFSLLIATELASLRRTEREASTANGNGDASDRTDEENDSGRDSAMKTNDTRTTVSHHEQTETNADEETIAIARSDLRLSLGILAGTTIYAGWVVTHVQEAWSFAVAFAAGLGLVFVGAMYYLAGDRSQFEDDGRRDDPADRSATDRRPDSAPIEGQAAGDGTAADAASPDQTDVGESEVS